MPRKLPPSMKKENVRSDGSSGGVGGGAGCCATATPAVRIRASRRLNEYLAFMRVSSGRVLRLHAGWAGRFQKFLEWFVNLSLLVEFESDLPFGLGEVEVGDCFGDRQKPVHIIRVRKHLERNIPRRYA